MPVILAIEPDRRQASRLSSLARTVVHGELEVVDSIDDALAWLETRTPDLILTSMLLSPKDDAALTARLRDLQARGAEAQTLVIPLLGETRGGEPASDRSSGRLFNRLRRARTDPSTQEGCDPAVFASQVNEYLERIAAERRDRAAGIVADEPAVLTSAPMLQELIQAPPPATPKPAAEWFSKRLPKLKKKAVAIASPAAEPEPIAEAQPVSEAEPVGARQHVAEPDHVPGSDHVAGSDHAAESDNAAGPDRTVEPDLVEEPMPSSAATCAADELWMPLAPLSQFAPAPLEGHVSKRPKRVSPVPTRKPPAPARRTVRVAATVTQPAPAPPAMAAAPIVEEPPVVMKTPPKRTPKATLQKIAPRPPKRPKAPPRPAYDEWGLYDPEQCGFAALLARLDAVTKDEGDDQEPRDRSDIMRR